MFSLLLSRTPLVPDFNLTPNPCSFQIAMDFSTNILQSLFQILALSLPASQDDTFPLHSHPPNLVTPFSEMLRG